MCRLTERIVRSGLVMAWRLATSPTSTSPDLANPTTDGVVRPPSAFGMTTGSPASSTDTTELVVPRSIPTALAILFLLLTAPSGTLTAPSGTLCDSALRPTLFFQRSVLQALCASGTLLRDCPVASTAPLRHPFSYRSNYTKVECYTHKFSVFCDEDTHLSGFHRESPGRKVVRPGFGMPEQAVLSGAPAGRHSPRRVRGGRATTMSPPAFVGVGIRTPRPENEARRPGSRPGHNPKENV